MFLSALAIVLAAQPETIRMKIDGTDRLALMYRPTVKTDHPPVVFAWHGHGGNARYSARRYDFQDAWPEAVVVYPEGIPIAGRTDPSGLKNGWNMLPVERNRDLKFFDALYAKVQDETHFDTGNCFCMGHSNGGGFCYTLWAARPDKFRAFAPHSAGGARMCKVPRAAFIVEGDNDPIVAPAQQEESIKEVRKLNQSHGPIQKLNDNLLQYPGVQPTRVWTHHNGHDFQPATVAAMVEFFKNLD